MQSTLDVSRRIQNLIDLSRPVRCLYLLLVVVLLLPPASAAASCPILDVTDPAYGAMGDDSLSDSAAFQDALDDAASCIASCGCGGAVVYVPPGEYLVANLKISSYVTLRGDGMGVSVLKFYSGPSNYILRNVDWGFAVDHSYIGLEELTFDGDNVSSASGPNFRRVSDLTVSHCEFRNFNNGMVIQEGGVRSLVQGCKAHHNSGIGFYAQKALGEQDEELIYSGCHSWDNGLNGFSAFDSEGITYVGCIATGNAQTGGAGFNLDSSRQVSYSGCISRGNGKWGFAVFASGSELAEDVSYSACTAEDNDYQGFKVSAVNGIALSGCHVQRNGILPDDSPAPYANSAGFFAVGPLKRLTITGGSFVGNGGHGIHVRDGRFATISGAVIMNNAAKAASRNGIYLEDTQRFLITNNMITDDQAQATQNFAVQSVGDSDFIYVYNNDVAGNMSATPISLVGTSNDTAHNPDG